MCQPPFTPGGLPQLHSKSGHGKQIIIFFMVQGIVSNFHKSEWEYFFKAANGGTFECHLPAGMTDIFGINPSHRSPFQSWKFPATRGKPDPSETPSMSQAVCTVIGLPINKRETRAQWYTLSKAVYVSILIFEPCVIDRLPWPTYSSHVLSRRFGILFKTVLWHAQTKQGFKWDFIWKCLNGCSPLCLPLPDVTYGLSWLYRVWRAL